MLELYYTFWNIWGGEWNILEYLEKNNEKQATIILDAEKALHSLNWTFLFKISGDMDFGEAFKKGGNRFISLRLHK